MTWDRIVKIVSSSAAVTFHTTSVLIVTRLIDIDRRGSLTALGRCAADKEERHSQSIYTHTTT